MAPSRLQIQPAAQDAHCIWSEEPVVQKCNKGRGPHTQKPSWALKREAPSPSFPESHTIQSPEPHRSLYFSTSEGQCPSSRVFESVKSMVTSPVSGWNSTT